MQDILREYGPAIITVIVAVSLIALVTLLFNGGADSIMGKAFIALIDKLTAKVG